MIPNRITTRSGKSSANSTAAAPRSFRHLTGPPSFSRSFRPPSLPRVCPRKRERPEPLSVRYEQLRRDDSPTGARGRRSGVDTIGRGVKAIVDGVAQQERTGNEHDGDQRNQERVLGCGGTDLATRQIDEPVVHARTEVPDRHPHVRVSPKQHLDVTSFTHTGRAAHPE